MRIWIVLLSVGLACGQFSVNQWSGRAGIVHLFEWKWTDIADECERFLAPMGFGGVQLSPATEHALVLDPYRPWWERYQPISYYLNTRSGTEAEFAQMVQRCNDVGVRIYADVVLNQMASLTEYGGTGGSAASSATLNYPAVPYNASDFNRECLVTEKSNPIERRDCRVLGLPDLNQGSERVRERITHLLNKMITYGVAGFRVDAAQHMWPKELQQIYSKLYFLAMDHGFPAGSRPFINQVVVDMTATGVSKYEYTSYGTITEFRYSDTLGSIFSGQQRLTALRNWGPAWGFPESERTLVFVDNFVNQRGHGPGKGNVLTYKDGKHYIMANAFMLAHTYGVPLLMSSYAFNNADQGPPSDVYNKILSPTVNADGSCGNGWICEHRWNAIANMIGFRNAVAGTEIAAWVDNGSYQLAFCRGSRGFIAFNLDSMDLDQTMQTCLPAGQYCDVISGRLSNGTCTGYTVEVASDGLARIFIASLGGYGVLAIHNISPRNYNN
ncbi:alpha-amylase 2 [Culex quinquefasciatus]|uniref:Alpha-amylase n=1 Tax=Culex quinquefasciatus TaxID=7176 RepID=B0WCW2_CULQU|nr:alpha-amylase 2 [Culex quinquefasciatus]|eukprot:XP_001846546.1 alpha-amylase 2 [Culex quinquefasciatus]